MQSHGWVTDYYTCKKCSSLASLEATIFRGHVLCMKCFHNDDCLMSILVDRKRKVSWEVASERKTTPGIYACEEDEKMAKKLQQKLLNCNNDDDQKGLIAATTTTSVSSSSAVSNMRGNEKRKPPRRRRKPCKELIKAAEIEKTSPPPPPPPPPSPPPQSTKTPYYNLFGEHPSFAVLEIDKNDVPDDEVESLFRELQQQYDEAGSSFFDQEDLFGSYDCNDDDNIIE